MKIIVLHNVYSYLQDVCTIMDRNSSNGTFKGSLKLKPNVVYALENGDIVTFGQILVKFTIVKENSNNETIEKENNFLVPETPITSKRMSKGWMIPDSQSSPLVQSNTKTKPGNNSSQNLSLNNSSSFLAPSQPISG